MRYTSCPISCTLINDSEFKVAGFSYIFLLFIYLFGGSIFIVEYIFIDILMRLTQIKSSPILHLSSMFVKFAKLKYKPKDEAPKKFALLLGSVMLLAVILSHFYSFGFLSVIIVSNLIFLKLLDVGFDYCVWV
jgi:hypothetical protein